MEWLQGKEGGEQRTRVFLRTKQRQKFVRVIEQCDEYLPLTRTTSKDLQPPHPGIYALQCGNGVAMGFKLKQLELILVTLNLNT